VNMTRRSFLQLLAGAAACVAVERIVKPIYFDFGANAHKYRTNDKPLERGPNRLDTGYIYAPYIPLFVSSECMEQIKSRYGSNAIPAGALEELQTKYPMTPPSISQLKETSHSTINAYMNSIVKPSFCKKVELRSPSELFSIARDSSFLKQVARGQV